MTKILIVSLMVVAAALAAAALFFLGPDKETSTTGSSEEGCIGCHTSLPLLSDLAVEEPVVEEVASCGAPPPNIPKAEKLLISAEFLEQDVHGKLGCTECHGGQPGDVTSAHQGVVRDPSMEGDACKDCHTEIVDRYATALHNTLLGQVTAVEARSHAGIMEQELAVVNEVDCATCHTSCGQCHVSRPNPAKGGLVAGHEFLGTPSMNEACIRCHGTSKEGGLYLADYGTGDVHWIQAAMTCTDCHSGTELHGSGVLYTNRYEVEEAPDCEDCHPQPGLDETGAHAIHQDKLSCYVCHSAGPVETCTGCHEGYNEDGTRFRTSEEISYVFKIGMNPDRTEEYPYEYVTVRKVPTVPDSFEGFGVTLENYDAVPTWKMSTPHNIKKTTRYNRSCDSCHGHPELFLSEQDLGIDPSDADLAVVVSSPPE